MENELAYFVLVYKSFMVKVTVDKLDLDYVTSFLTINVIKLFFFIHHWPSGKIS
jgi:hypothetical protein